jgi:hypothetical protein
MPWPCPALPYRSGRMIPNDMGIPFWGAWSYRGGLMRLLIIRLPAYLFGTSRGGVGCGVWGRLEGRLAAVEGFLCRILHLNFGEFLFPEGG